MNPTNPLDMAPREIRIPLDEVVAILQDLNEFVVSAKDASTAPSAR